jgi:hypothetical protein
MKKICFLFLSSLFSGIKVQLAEHKNILLEIKTTHYSSKESQQQLVEK